MVEKTRKVIKHKPRKLGLCFFSGLLVLMLCLTACEKESQTEAYISISKDSISISTTGGEETTRIKSDQDWNITGIDQDWVEADPMSGEAGVMTTVTLTVAKNTE